MNVPDGDSSRPENQVYMFVYIIIIILVLHVYVHTVVHEQSLHRALPRHRKEKEK